MLCSRVVCLDYVIDLLAFSEIATLISVVAGPVCTPNITGKCVHFPSILASTCQFWKRALLVGKEASRPLYAIVVIDHWALFYIQSFETNISVHYIQLLF